MLHFPFCWSASFIFLPSSSSSPSLFFSPQSLLVHLIGARDHLGFSMDGCVGQYLKRIGAQMRAPHYLRKAAKGEDAES